MTHACIPRADCSYRIMNKNKTKKKCTCIKKHNGEVITTIIYQKVKWTNYGLVFDDGKNDWRGAEQRRWEKRRTKNKK